MKLPDIEVVSAKVHEAWMEAKRAAGGVVAPIRDGRGADAAVRRPVRGSKGTGPGVREGGLCRDLGGGRSTAR
jgi:hypothetical protein